MRRRSSFALTFTLGLGLGLGLTGVALTAMPAAAQPAAALGKPLPSAELPTGTVSVRIVAGSTSSPVVGTDVTLVVNNTPRVARTNAEGRATFAGLPVGAKVLAKVLDEDKAEHASEEFAIPDAGGTKVMITTKPWQAGAGGGAPFAGGAGMPNPRQLSGEARPEQADPAGTITVRVAYDDFKDTPEGLPVVLVGYAADDTTTYQVVPTDKTGRAQFTNLDRSGGTSYFAMTLLPRGGAVDRLVSQPVVLESQVGMRMVLSGEKRDSKAPPVDDLGRADPQVATPAGKVRVAIDGGLADRDVTITLIDAATRKVLGETKPQAASPDPARISGGEQFSADPALPAGTLDIEAVGGPGQTEKPLEGITIRVIDAGSTDATAGPTAMTGADGKVRMTAPAAGPQKAVFTIHGRSLLSRPFDMTKSGGKLKINAQWEEKPEALLDVAPTPGQVVYAECSFKNQRYRSEPVQLLESTGTKLTVIVYPRVMFRFQLQAMAQDQQLSVQGRFEITNYAWAPYRAGPDGLVVPMPHGFKGGVVAESDQNEVSVAANEGFRLIRPLPPGGRTFHAGFFLSVEDGQVAWALDLPLGAYQSQLVIEQPPGMTVHTPPNVQGESRTVPQGTFYVIQPITIGPKQSMVMSIEGLPSKPAWRMWLPRIVGVLAVGVMLAGIFFALARKQPSGADAAAAAARDARRQKLLDELVELERTGENPKRREHLLGELEQLWG